MHLVKKDGINIRLDLHEELKNFEKTKQYTIPIFIPHKGCKNECVFCNQRKISGQIVPPTTAEVDKTIKEYLTYFKDKKEKINIEVAFFGGSFSGLPINEQIEYLEVAHKYVLDKSINGIRISTRPDYIMPTELNILKKYGVTTIELGVQSMDDNVLNVCKRGHKSIDTIRASKLIKLWGFKLGHQIMIGLPKSNKNSEEYTIKQSLKLMPSELRIYPVYVLKESALYEKYLQGSYTPLGFNEAIDRVLNVVKFCQKTNVKIIRLGLQSTDEITSSSKDIVGPVCDNFAEYVMAEIVREKMEKEILKRNISENRKVIFEIPGKYASIVAGPKKINKVFFESHYNIKIGVKEI